jgi:hypothetical protein
VRDFVRQLGLISSIGGNPITLSAGAKVLGIVRVFITELRGILVCHRQGILISNALKLVQFEIRIQKLEGFQVLIGECFKNRSVGGF